MQSEQRMQIGQPVNPFARPMTKAVRIIMIVTVSAFLVQTIVDLQTRGMHRLGLFTLLVGLSWQSILKGFIWQPVTYMFLHSLGFMHILMNMLGLYFFGCEMEEVLGVKRFVKLYFATGVLGGLGWLVISLLMGETGSVCIGASGALLGIIGVFAAMFPDRMITLLLFFVLPVTISARMLAIGIGVISVGGLMMSGSVAHGAHLAGGIAGYLYGLKVAKNPGMLNDSIDDGAGSGLWVNIRAFFLRRKMKVVSSDEVIPTQAEVDAVLEKISASGMGSLTRSEKQMLERASEGNA